MSTAAPDPHSAYAPGNDLSQHRWPHANPLVVATAWRPILRPRGSLSTRGVAVNAEQPHSDATIRRRRTQRPVHAPNGGEGAPTYLLEAKLAPPRPPAGFVVRPRVSAMFEAAAARPLTVVSAGPGWGKTLAAAAWAASGPAVGKLAWVSLDEGDSEPRLFWSYVLTALRRSGAVPPDNDLAELVPGPAVDEEIIRRILYG